MIPYGLQLRLYREAVLSLFEGIKVYPFKSIKTYDTTKTLDEDNKDEEFHFYMVNYEISVNDKLIIKLISKEIIETLIKEGKLKGELIKKNTSKEQSFDRLIVTSSSEELVETISREGVETFIDQDPNDILVFSKGN